MKYSRRSQRAQRWCRFTSNVCRPPVHPPRSVFETRRRHSRASLEMLGKAEEVRLLLPDVEKAVRVGADPADRGQRRRDGRRRHVLNGSRPTRSRFELQEGGFPETGTRPLSICYSTQWAAGAMRNSSKAIPWAPTRSLRLGRWSLAKASVPGREVLRVPLLTSMAVTASPATSRKSTSRLRSSQYWTSMPVPVVLLSRLPGVIRDSARGSTYYRHPGAGRASSDRRGSGRSSRIRAGTGGGAAPVCRCGSGAGCRGRSAAVSSSQSRLTVSDQPWTF